MAIGGETALDVREITEPFHKKQSEIASLRAENSIFASNCCIGIKASAAYTRQSEERSLVETPQLS